MRAERMLARARRDGTSAAALMIGLDNFKSVNETLSRSAGDELLRLVAQRLDSVVRADARRHVQRCRAGSAQDERLFECLLDAIPSPFEPTFQGVALRDHDELVRCRDARASR